MVENQPTQEGSAPQPQTVPETQPALPKPNKTPMVIMVILTILSLLLSGYLTYQNTQLKKKISQVQATPSPAAVAPSPSTDPTALWETYNNTKYNYSFKHPSKYIVGQNGMNSPTPEISSHILVHILEENDEPGFSISVTQKDEETLEQKANKHFDRYGEAFVPNSDSNESNQVISPITKTEFLGKEAYTYIIEGIYVNDGASESISPLYERTFLWFENNNNVFFIRIDDVNPTNLIIPTFEFTQ